MKNTGIPVRVRNEVLERDSVDGHPVCQFCGSPYTLELAHYVSRARGGMGVKENLVTLCHKCHQKADNGDGEHIKRLMWETLKRHYPDLEEKDVIYSKW